MYIYITVNVTANMTADITAYKIIITITKDVRYIYTTIYTIKCYIFI